MRCITWNVNGIRAVARKHALPWDRFPDADLIAVQETKAAPSQLDPDLVEPDGWQAVWVSAAKAGYSGVALFSRQLPDRVLEGLGVDEFDVEGRVVTGCFGDLAVVCAYFPNSQEGGKRVAYKVRFCQAMEHHLARLQSDGCHTLLLGDYNIAHRPIDLARPKENEGSAGYLPEERAWMDHYLNDLGYRDVFRERNPELTGAYTWWTYRGGARSRNVGWRIDYGTTSPALAERVTEATIHPEVAGSDHCPVGIVLA